MQQIAALLKDLDKFNRFLNVEYAFHSSFMEPVKEDLLNSLKDIQCKPPKTPLWSTVTGEKVRSAIHNSDYWWQNVRQTVLFGPAIENIIKTHRLFLEISAHPVLAPSVRQCLKGKRITGRCIQSLDKNNSDGSAMSKGINDLVQAGYPLDWGKIYPVNPIPHIDFWPYSWQKKEYWEESTINSQSRLAKVDDILLGRRFDYFDTPTWSNQLDLKIQSFLSDHKVKTHIFFPAAGYIDIFCAAASQCVGEFFELEDFSILMSVVLSTSEVKNIRCNFDPDTHQLILKVSGDGHTQNWDVCATCKVYQVSGFKDSRVDFDALIKTGIVNGDKKTFYRRASEEGLNYGPHFQTLHRYWALDNQILGYIKLPKDDKYLFDNTYISPTVLDGVFQLIALKMNPVDFDTKLYLPVGFDKLIIQKTAGDNLYALINVVEHTLEQIRADITMYNEKGNKTGIIQNFICKAVDTKDNESAQWRKSVLYEYWTPKPLDWSSQPSVIGSFNDKALTTINQAKEREKALNLKNHVLMLPEFFENKNRLMIRFFVDAIYKIIENYQIGDPIDLKFLVKDSGIAEKLLKYTHKILTYLHDGGYAQKTDGDEYRLTTKVNELGSIEVCMDDCVRENPSAIYELNLIYERGYHLVPLFQGKYDPLEMLVGKDRSDYARYFYTHSSWFQGNNQIVMAIIKEMTSMIPQGKPFRVLEIGSGMGGMTTHILPLLKQCACEFYFTDIAPGLVKQGKRQFRDYDFITYQVLDIEQDIESQGLEPGTFDLITGLDVIHAVRDIDIALGHVGKLLKPGGKFLLSEIVGKQLFENFLFGPIDGWWLFDDSYRTDSPLLNQHQWEEALGHNNFKDIYAVSDCNGNVHMNFIATKKEEIGIGKKLNSHFLHLPENNGWMYIGDANIPESTGFEYLYSLNDLKGNIDLQGIKGVVYGGALNAVVCPDNESRQRDLVDLLFSHIIALTSDSNFIETNTRLFVLTSGAFFISKNQDMERDRTNVLQAAMEGLVNVLYNEKPSLRIKLIDLDPGLPLSNQVSLLVQEITAETDTEDHVAFRKGQRFVKRCDFISRPRSEFRYNCLDDSQNSHAIGLTVDSPGSLDGLCLETIKRECLQPDEVEIRVEAAGINFRDLLKVLGVYPTEVSDNRILGDECAGVVVRTGKSVTSFSKGDRVAVIGLGCFKTHLILPAKRLIRLPDFMSMDLAAASLTNYMTVYYALVIKACIKPGDRILIHSAAGGVGLAAIQMSHLKGAEVFATAGTRFKRDLLKSFGVNHVYNSRTLDFSDKIYLDTNGEGVDIVLNSLAGPFIEKSLNLLRNYGRFLELGKRDIYDKTHIGLYPFRKNISYFAIDMAEMFTQDSTVGKNVMEEFQTLLKNNIVDKHCYSLFSMANYKEAFSHMSKALHFGKVVLKPSWGELTCPVQFKPDKVHVDKEKSYLIIGGVRGLGLVIAQWLVEKGGKTIILVNRSGHPHPESESEINDLQNKAKVLIYKTDVGDRQQVAGLIQKIRRDHPPLDGVFHCAVVLKDNEIQKLTKDDVYDVLAPKAFGGIHLHEETKDLDLSFFLLMGSMASFMGNLGQSNYAAANTVLKSIAALRQKQGLAVQYIDWGLFQETGVVSRDKKLLEKVLKLGFGGLTTDNFRDFLDRILGNRQIIWGVPGSDFEKNLIGVINMAPRFSLISNRTKAKKNKRSGSFVSDFVSLSTQIRLEKMIELVKLTISDLLDLAVEDIEDDDKLVDLGIDSLNGIELLTQFENELGASISPTSLVQAPSVRLISERLLTILGLEYDAPKEKIKTVLINKTEAVNSGIDTDLDKALEQARKLPNNSKIIRDLNINKVIFLTGVTGLLGSRLLRDIINQTTYKVYLLIRPENGNTNLMTRLQDTIKKFNLDLDLAAISHRIKLFKGDIAQPNLGLTPKAYDEIQQTAGIVLHSAAQVNHLKPYHLLKKANVDGTLEILKLCITQKEVIPLHYVSTISILVTDFTHSNAFTEDDIPETLSEIQNGYIKSKWISEHVLRKMQKKHFPCNIYRPGLIFDNKSMITLAGDFIWRVFNTSLIMGKYPDSGINLLLAPLENVSDAIIGSILANHMGQTYHLCETKTQFRDLSLEAIDLGFNLKPVTAGEWHELSLQLFKDNPLGHPLADYLNAFDIRIVQLMTLMSEHPFNLSCSKTLDLLSSMERSHPKVPVDVLRECILALQKEKSNPLSLERV